MISRTSSVARVVRSSLCAPKAHFRVQSVRPLAIRASSSQVSLTPLHSRRYPESRPTKHGWTSGQLQRTPSGHPRVLVRGWSSGAGGGGIPQISCEEAAAMMEADWEYLDVRSEQEFDEAHIEGSVNIPVFHKEFGGMTMNEEFLQQVQAAFPDKDTKFLMGCAAGVRSMRAAEMMASVGYHEMVNVAPGFMGWAQAGLPYVTK
mmetsp:Transcript_36286/g.43835  ORF Transcript_36286/g.43835 Transcript_36286/m.43835 type:complete len:204 (-) Transcript_36286:73-684(-)